MPRKSTLRDITSGETDGLTPKQRIFVAEYLKDGNGTRAALAAGASTRRNASAQASTWMDPKRFPRVVEAVQRGQAERAARSVHTGVDLKAEDLVRELARIALFNPQELFDKDMNLRDLHSLPPDVARCIRDFKVSQRVSVDPQGKPCKVRTVEVKLHDKLEALNQLGKHLGLFKDVTNINNTVVNMIDWNALFDAVPTQDQINQRIQQVEALCPPPSGPGVNGESVVIEHQTPTNGHSGVGDTDAYTNGHNGDGIGGV